MREMLAWSRASHKLLSEHIRLSRAIHRLQEPSRVLSRLARHLPRLVCLEFAQGGIREQPPSVPQELEKSDANSALRPGELPATSSPQGGTGHIAGMSPRWGPILTDTQWELIGEIVESLRDELDSDRKYRRHIDRPDPRLLLQGILLKLAFGFSWEDLPRLFDCQPPAANRQLPTAFPLRAARELYRQLYTSGRMSGIYRRLAWHLRVHGGTTPEELVASGAFLLDGPRIRLAAGTDLTWETFTALLLLQRAFHNYRVFLRERTLDRRSRGLYLRLRRLRPNPPIASRPNTENRLPVTVGWPPPESAFIRARPRPPMALAHVIRSMSPAFLFRLSSFLIPLSTFHPP